MKLLLMKEENVDSDKDEKNLMIIASKDFADVDFENDDKE